jgi:NAD(P)-dependent dehydrogenase (short-subunit alcohol dehydrogenase family)
MSNNSAPPVLEGRAALVTGSSKGIGRALAVGLAQNGASVAVNYKTDEQGAIETAALITDAGGEAVVIGADLSKPAEAKALVDEAAERLGRLDVLVNNAGRSRFSLFEDATEEDWEDVVGTNLRGTFFASQAAVKHMRALGKGSIVNVSSCASVLMVVYHAAYTMSKGGLDALTRQLAFELAPVIRVNAIAPGATGVERSRQYDPDFDETWGAVVPMGRVIEPEDLVEPVVFLASDRSAVLTGDVLHVDGGWSIQGVVPAMDEFDIEADQKRG